MRQLLAREPYAEKIHKVGQLIRLAKTFPRRQPPPLRQSADYLDVRENSSQASPSPELFEMAKKLLDQHLQLTMRYELIIYWSKADESFVVEVPELPGCMADGATYEEAIANAQIVIAEWMETAQSLNRPIPEPRGKLIYA